MRIVLIMFVVLLSTHANAAQMTFSGDKKLSCEAVLCLSTPTPPKECKAALSHYYGIQHKKWKDTIRARQNFLKLCPKSE